MPVPVGVNAQDVPPDQCSAGSWSYLHVRAVGSSCLISGEVMSHSQQSDSRSPYEKPSSDRHEAVPAVPNGPSGQAWQQNPPACQPPVPAPTPADGRPDSLAAPGTATMLLIVGLPGAGKTTRAKELATAARAIRLTPDDWMIPIFGLRQFHW